MARQLLVHLMATLLTAFAATADATVTVDLGGTWQTMKLAEKRFPAPEEEGWVDVDVVAPASAGEWLCQRRVFRLPQAGSDQRLFLRFEGVKYSAEVRCNGQPVGSHKGGYEPFECEITAVVRPGRDNSVEVLAGSWHQLTADPEEARGFGFGRDGVDQAVDGILYPIGSHHTMGIWAPVTLVARPSVYIEDVYVTTSLRRKRICVETTLRNLSASPVDVGVGHTVRRDAGAVLAVESRNACVPANGRTTVIQEATWVDPPLWWPHDPVLLHADTTLTVAGATHDRHMVRFGFREVWTDGPMVVLNGVPLHLLGNSCHPLGYTRAEAENVYDLCRQAHINCFRLHAQPWGQAWYDVADETGMLIVHETAVWCFVRQYALGDDRFWGNFAEHVRAQIRLHRNRPSVISWSLENEVLHCGGTRVESTEQRLADLADVARELDDTRLIGYDADEDPMGAADIVNLHYPNEFPAVRTYPDCCWWLNTTRKVHGWPRREWHWDRRKPLYIGEYLWSPSSTPDRYTLFHGDEAYTDMHRFQVAGKAAAWRYQIEAYRAEGLSGGCPWNIFEGGRLPNSAMYQAVKAAYRPQCAVMRQCSTTFFAGSTLRRDITFINDVLRPAALTAVCRTVQDGRAVDEVRIQLPMEPAEIRRETVELAVPGATARTPFILQVLLTEKGSEVFREDTACWAMPPEPAPSMPPGALAVFDPRGETAAVLAQAGLATHTVPDLVSRPAAATCLLVGEGAFTSTEGQGATVVGAADDRWSGLFAIAEAGGTVVVLAQEHMPQRLAVRLLSDGSTIAFVRRPHHPAVAGCRDDDFRHWPEGHLVSRFDMARPDRGANRVIVDAGDSDGVSRALFVEARHGKGRFVFCQLLLVEKFTSSPVARRTLLRLLADAVGPPRPTPRLLALLSDDTRVGDALVRVGAATADDWSLFRKAAAFLVDGDRAELAGAWPQVDQWVRAGGILWLHGVTDGYLRRLGLLPDTAVWEDAALAPVHAKPGPGLGAGLRNEDLYWLGPERPKRHSPWGLSPAVTGAVLRPAFDPRRAVKIPIAQLDNSAVKITRRADEGVWLSTNGTVTSPITVPRDGRYVVAVRAGGTPMGNVFPVFRVAVGDRSLGGFAAVSREPRTYTVNGELVSGEHELRISFVNDASSPPNEDRNALVSGAAFGPAEPFPPSITTLTEPAALWAVSRGLGTVLVDGIAWQEPGSLNTGKAQSFLATLLTNAGVALQDASAGTPVPLDSFVLQADVPHVERRAGGLLYLGNTAWTEAAVEFARGGTYDVLVEARGTEAKGEFPELELWVDGERVVARSLSSAGWHTTVFGMDVEPGTRTLRLRFTNDYYDPALHLDRNLWIRRVAVAGRRQDAVRH